VGEALKGRAVLHVAPDAWIPADRQPFRVELEMDARIAGDEMKGAYKVTAVSSASPGVQKQFAGRSGELAGRAATEAPPNLPEKATFELRLHGALIGGDPAASERCMVVQLALDGDRVVSAFRALWDREGNVCNHAVAVTKGIALTRLPDGLKGRIEIEAETLDMEPAVYDFEIEARAVSRLASSPAGGMPGLERLASKPDRGIVGLYRLRVTAEGGGMTERECNFDGEWSEGLTPWKLDARPWFVTPAGFVPPQPGEHPRLLFRKSDLPALRKKAETPEGKAILARLRQTLNGGDGETMPKGYSTAIKAYGGGTVKDDEGQRVSGEIGIYTMSHVAGYGLLYQLTGDGKYAELGRQCFEKALQGIRDRDNRYSFRMPGGALRAGVTLGWYAVGYDLCYDGWDAATRERFGRAIAEYDEGKEDRDARTNLDLATIARGTISPGSNHFGMEIGGTGLALLAVRGEPFVDQKRIEALLKINERNIVRNLTLGFGDGGFFAEGDGTGSMSSQIAFIGALQAWKNAGGHDYIVVERPNARMMALKWIYLTVIRDGKPDFWPQRGAYPHNIWTRTGLSGAGYFSIGMGGVTEEQKAAMKWYYDRFLLEHDVKNGTPYDTVSEYPHFAVCSFVNWPVGVEARNPAEVLPRCFRDTIHGFVGWRNRWQDTNDVVISVLLKPTRGYYETVPDGTLKIMGFGRQFSWGPAVGDVTHWWQDERAAATVLTTKNVSTAVDFTGLSGAEMLLATTGGGNGFSVETSAGKTVQGTPFRGRGTTLTVKCFPEGRAPAPTAKDGVITVGKRTVAVKDGNIVLGKVE
jgi:hypothetical protein